jgi:hypothetical protein
MQLFVLVIMHEAMCSYYDKLVHVQTDVHLPKPALICLRLRFSLLRNVTRSFTIVFAGKENYTAILKETLMFNLCHICVDLQPGSVVGWIKASF